MFLARMFLTIGSYRSFCDCLYCYVVSAVKFPKVCVIILFFDELTAALFLYCCDLLLLANPV